VKEIVQMTGSEKEQGFRERVIHDVENRAVQAQRAAKSKAHGREPHMLHA